MVARLNAKTGSMKTILITCDTCHRSFTVERSTEIPENVASLACNWCIECEKTNPPSEYWEERYIFYEDKPVIEEIDINQLELPL